MVSIHEMYTRNWDTCPRSSSTNERFSQQRYLNIMKSLTALVSMSGSVTAVCQCGRGLVTTAPVYTADAAAAAARHATESCPRILSALSLCMARKQPPAHVTSNTGTNYHLINQYLSGSLPFIHGPSPELYTEHFIVNDGVKCPFKIHLDRNCLLIAAFM